MPLRLPRRQATSSAYLSLEGSNPLFPFLLATFLLLMPLLLHRTITPRPCLVPDWRLCVCGPVPHFSRDPLSLHADSHCSSLTLCPDVVRGPATRCFLSL